jgi:hypothetical protein
VGEPIALEGDLGPGTFFNRPCGTKSANPGCHPRFKACSYLSLIARPLEKRAHLAHSAHSVVCSTGSEYSRPDERAGAAVPSGRGLVGDQALRG